MSKKPKQFIKLSILAAQIRKQILEMIVKARGTHIASAFSIVEILLYLYAKVLHVNPKRLKAVDRDIFILSKGHGGAALYVILAHFGFYPKKELEKYCSPGGILGGHPDGLLIPGVEISTGSLGHGLSVAVGFALANKINKVKAKVYCLVGDGECNEGSIWEAVQVARHYRLDNLVLIIDNNKLMISGFTKDIIDPLSFREKFSAFGWKVFETGGHNLHALSRVFDKALTTKGLPTVIIADTIKGKGVSFMENDKYWHGALPTDEQMVATMKELNERIVLLENKLKI